MRPQIDELAADRLRLNRHRKAKRRLPTHQSANRPAILQSQGLVGKNVGQFMLVDESVPRCFACLDIRFDVFSEP